MIPPILLRKCKENEMLSCFFEHVTDEKMYKMFGKIVNTTMCTNHTVPEIHNLHEYHKRQGIDGKHLEQFEKCIHEAYDELNPIHDIRELEPMKCLLALLKEIIDHESVCTMSVILDIEKELDKMESDKELIKSHLKRLRHMIHSRIGC